MIPFVRCTKTKVQRIFFAVFYKVAANIGRVIDNPTVIVYYKP
jgi:hypothetical protein